MDLTFSTIKEVEFNFSQDEFLSAVNVWISKPHVLNKRILSFEFIREVSCPDFTSTHIKQVSTVVSESSDLETDINNYWINVSDENGNGCKNVLQIKIHKMIPRNENLFKPCVELVIYNPGMSQVTFFNLSPHVCKPSIISTIPYMFHYDSNKVHLKILQTDLDTKTCSCEAYRTKTLNWLQDTLLPKLIKWASNSNTNSIGSLQLIDSMSKYSKQYNELKLKYGKEIVQIWPEVTDPNKFVYEDIAIACYLILLWGKQATSFVDLGCGNGLLVHILNSEGHKGFGIDVRKRKIWNMYPPSTILQVSTISPSSSSALFPTTEWIIGNHSDELTPWIPVIAARSHIQCKMFLLPCCAYQFNGRKYQRRNSKLSVYNDYMNFIIQDVCSDLCQFHVEVDRLRIPSTKRIAIVCRSRRYNSTEFNRVDESIAQFLKRCDDESNSARGDGLKSNEGARSDELEGIEGARNVAFEANEGTRGDGLKPNEGARSNECNASEGKETASNKEVTCVADNRGKKNTSAEGNGEHRSKRMKSNEAADEWMKDVKTRETKEAVRNCTQLDKGVVQALVDVIVEHLLCRQLASNTSWSEENSYEMSLKDVITAVQVKDATLLRELGKQNGGIKTFIRNKHDVFSLVNDQVRFRRPAVRERNEHWKSRVCWFQLNHPFRCPLSSDECSFIH